MKYLILACLGVFTLERYWLLKGQKQDNCLGGLGLVVMFAAAMIALIGQVRLVWWGP